MARTKNPRTIRVRDEEVGTQLDGTRIMFVADVRYTKGRGYVFNARIERETKTGMRAFLLVTGIRHTELLAPASRFSAKRLAGHAAFVKANLVDDQRFMLKAELDRRIAAGKDY